MVDREIIDYRLSKLRDYANRLNATREMSLQEFLEQTDQQLIAERCLQVCIETVIDIGNHIIAAKGLGKPKDYRSVLEILGSRDVLPQDFAQGLLPLLGLRNRLVHQYDTIDRKLLFENLKQNLDHFRRFAELIVSYLERESGQRR
ncbi:DUF86 domain-containing protein [Acidobacteria bacterium AH-259-G07]|nr:DUF86 domain-containing protein [Acidobacteria bacterium AH-259-G07]